ncbi:MAG: BamA/TamA family outer membrane protein [Deltaproteobacteria bacterium]|nr:MAG: BamA/TamA family outer membrane protein [Deltaproteobacteria bacterium]
MLKISQITFEGAHRFSERTLQSALKLQKGSVLTKEKLSSDLQKLALLYANVGYPYTVISHDIFQSPEGNTLSFKIDEGSEVHIQEILIVGNERSSEKSILKSILFKRGDLFSYQKIIESERQLRRTGSYRSANIETIGLAEKSSQVHLLVKLEEFKKILMDLGIAYNTDTNFTGTLSLSNVNVFGTNKRASLNFTMGQEIQKGEALLRDPHFLNTSLVGTLSGKIEKQIRPGFTTVDAGNSISVLKEFSPRLSLLSRYEITQTFFSDVTDVTGAQEQDHTTSKFSFSTSYDKRDSFSDPRKGYIFLGGFDVSNKLIASTFNFIQPRGYFAHFLPLIGPFTLMSFVRVEGIKVFGDDNLTRDRKLFLGGDYSIRGFEEDGVGPLDSNGTPLGGQFLLLNTVELQTKLIQSLKLALFFDNGSLTDDISTVSVNTFRQSAGFGLRYITPVGPLRLDYGIKLDRRPEESFGRLHFAFGYSF